MRPDDSVYLGHMLDMSRKATEKVAGLSRLDYDADENLRLALAHLVQVTGEAARRVSTELREAHPEIPWADIVGMRSKIVHDYMNVDEDIVWEVVTRDLPALVAALEKLVPEEL
jgi:uncharacterized protein with HEPN domain